MHNKVTDPGIQFTMMLYDNWLQINDSLNQVPQNADVVNTESWKPVHLPSILSKMV